MPHLIELHNKYFAKGLTILALTNSNVDKFVEENKINYPVGVGGPNSGNYGVTGIPQVYYGYQTDPDDNGGWTVKGEARLLSEPGYDFTRGRIDVGGTVSTFATFLPPTELTRTSSPWISSLAPVWT